MADEIYVTTMEPEHLDQVMTIEEKCFTSPWGPNTFLREITENPYALYLVAVERENVVGYCGTWFVLDEAHITNLAVDPRLQRRGVAKLLLHHLFALARTRGVRRATLEVRHSNMSARRLYSSLGFTEAGIRPGYYSDNNEDAVIMWLEDIGKAGREAR